MIEIKAGQVGLKCALEDEHGIPVCEDNDATYNYDGKTLSAIGCIKYPRKGGIGWLVCPHLIIQPYKYDKQYNHDKPKPQQK